MVTGIPNFFFFFSQDMKIPGRQLPLLDRLLIITPPSKIFIFSFPFIGKCVQKKNLLKRYCRWHFKRAGSPWPTARPPTKEHERENRIKRRRRGHWNCWITNNRYSYRRELPRKEKLDQRKRLFKIACTHHNIIIELLFTGEMMLFFRGESTQSSFRD